MRMNNKALSAAIAASALFLSAARLANAALPESGKLDFTVLRGGSEIGTHRLEFSRQGDELKVDIGTDIAVKMLGIAVYRFEHEGHETWRDGQLVSLESKTNDDGTPHHLAVNAADGKLVVNGDARQGDENPDVIPASLWNEDLVKQNALLNTLDGSSMDVTVREVGPETVEVNGEPVTATHYSVTGKLERELWYDAAGVLVQVKFAGSDGSEISYVLK